MSKVWFITGAGRGIGTHIVHAALAAGDRVVATGRQLSQLQSAFAEVDRSRISLVELDIAQPEQAVRAVQAALDAFGRIDVLVNNAGYGLLGHFEELDPAEIETQFAVNVHGLMHVMRAVLPVMRNQRAGHIINFSSIGGLIGFRGASVYCATKYAIEGLSASLALEVEQFGIHVTVVEPGFFRTEFLAPTSVRYGKPLIADYAEQGSVRDAYQAYHGKQLGDPARLGTALVQLAALNKPPRQFLAGSDALAMATAGIAAHRAEIDSHAALSASTDGVAA